ncbi:MAG TPA: lysylphosphatidylglycerol synthetase family protein [Candidatus Cloacimonas sp.]|nr:lysylphosphatidylglycerol synthetase family protein [Candidatus Cloacimonas sp.]
MNTRNKVFLTVGSLIGIGLIVLWLSYIPLGELKEYFSRIRPLYVVWASLCYLGAYFVRSFRWNLILRQSMKIPLRDTWLYAMGGNLVNYIIPIRAGELVKCWFIKKNHNLGMAQSLPSVFIDKTFDTLAIISVIFLIPFLTIKLNPALNVLLAILLLVFIISVSLLLLAAWRKDLVLRVLSVLVKLSPQSLKARMKELLEQFVDGLNLFEHKPAKLVWAVILTMIGILLDGLYFYLIFEAFGIEFSFLMVLFGYTLINMSYALPQPPAQLGSNEWMMIIIFSLGFNLTKSSASAIMAFAHILTALLMGIVGAFAFAYAGFEVLKMIFKGEKIDG